MSQEKTEKNEERKNVLQEFVDDLTETLTHWVEYASKLRMPVSASSNIIPLELIRMSEIVNLKLNYFRDELKINYKVYKELEKKYELKPLSLSYLESYAITTKNLSDALNEVKTISGKYSYIVKHIKKTYNINIDEYISPINQKAIEKICNLTLENLLEMLQDNLLLGL